MTYRFTAPRTAAQTGTRGALNLYKVKSGRVFLGIVYATSTESALSVAHEAFSANAVLA